MSSFFALNASFLTIASPWGYPVKVLAETTSTNDELLRIGELGDHHSPFAPNGSLLFAERQTAGRGQFHRPWASNQPLGLWFSLLLRMEISDSTTPALSSFAAVAIAETLSELGFSDIGIKPPNDIYLGARKVAGILIETRLGKNPFAVVGIGLNVNQRTEDFPQDLKMIATSLVLASGCPAGSSLDRNQIASPLLRSLAFNEKLMREHPSSLLKTWKRSLIDPLTLTQSIR